MKKLSVPKSATCGTCDRARRITLGDPVIEDLEFRDGCCIAGEVTIPMICATCDDEVGRVRVPIEHVVTDANATIELDNE